MKKKILHVIDSLGVGGAEKLLVGIINELKDFENHLLIFRGPETLRPEMHGLASFENMRSPSLKRSLTMVPAVRRLIRSKGVDLIHSHLYESNIMTRLAAPSGVPVFNSIHAVSSLASYNESRLSYWLEKLTYKKKHRIIGVSHTVLDDFNKYIGIKGPATVLYNFIEDVFFENAPKQSFNRSALKLVAVGNLRHQKNYPYLLEAFRHLPKNISIDVYGEGTLREELQSEIDRHGLNIHLKGLRDDLHRVLPQYDLFVMCSHFEGQPVSLLEAMACGLPSALSDIPVLREVGQAASALYFDLSNPRSLANKIMEVSGGQHDLAAMSEKGYRFSFEHAKKTEYMNQLQSLYLSI